MASTDSCGKSFCRRLQERRFVMNLEAVSNYVFRHAVRYASAVNCMRLLRSSCFTHVLQAQ